MRTLFRTNQKKLFNIKCIIYDNFINLKTDIKIPNNIVNGNHIKIEDLKKINNDIIQNSNEIIIPSMDLTNKKINYFNHNENNKCKIKEHTSFYDMVINGKNDKIFNLSNYFSYELRPNYGLNNYIITPKNKTKLSNLSIVNCIVFGEDNIRFDDIEKLLTLVRLKDEKYRISLDNFILINYCNSVIKINSDDKELNKMEFCKYQDILECCKWLIQIMNNINSELINYHNYHTLVEYCKKYDNYYEEKFNNLIKNEKYRIEKETNN